jgi:DNA-binding NtrC family response regulator
LTQREATSLDATELPQGPVQLDEVLAQTERRLFTWALTQANGNQSEAAHLLGIPRSTFQYRWRRLGDPGDGKGPVD